MQEPPWPRPGAAPALPAEPQVGQQPRAQSRGFVPHPRGLSLIPWLLLPGICQRRAVTGVLVLPAADSSPQGTLMLIFSHLLLITDGHPALFMAEGEQMFKQDVQSPPKCSVCTESCTFGGWGMNFVPC